LSSKSKIIQITTTTTTEAAIPKPQFISSRNTLVKQTCRKLLHAVFQFSIYALLVVQLLKVRGKLFVLGPHGIPHTLLLCVFL
jgi:hypothetical protein